MQTRDKTERMEAALRFIIDYRESEKIAPTVREVQEYLGVSSPSTAYEIIKSLRKSGRISSKEHCPRSITVREEKGSGQKDR